MWAGDPDPNETHTSGTTKEETVEVNILELQGVGFGLVRPLDPLRSTQVFRDVSCFGSFEDPSIL